MRNVLSAAFFITVAFGVAVYQIMPKAESQMNYAQGVNVSSNGVIRVDAWTCYNPQPPGATPTTVPPAKPCPVRIELAIEVLDDVLICRSVKTGQVCKTVKEVFSSVK